MGVTDKYDYRYWQDKSNYVLRDYNLHVQRFVDLEEKLISLNKIVDLQWPDWGRNVKENLRHITEEDYLKNIYGQWHGSKVLVVGAGPSFRRNIDEIRRAKDAGWKLIVCDRAYEPLKKAGINADIVITIDAALIVRDFLDCLDERDTVAACVMQNPKILWRARGKGARVYAYAPSNPFSQQCIKLYKKGYADLCCLKAEFIVGYTAIYLAINMGAAEIALIGNELCWFDQSEIEKIYIDEKKTVGFYRSVNRHGKQVHTVKAFVGAAQAILKIVKMYNKIKFTDCSFGILEGMDQLTMEELLEGKNEKSA